MILKFFDLYLHYNQQRFVSYTRDGMHGLAKLLDKTNLMTWQNGMALDMLLTKEGGVCRMFGDMCCTFIPKSNTLTLTQLQMEALRAIQGLSTLSQELAENSGVDDPFTRTLES